MHNRSVPADIVLPHIAYRDLPQAIAWLSNAFGFTQHYRYGDPISGAQLRLGNAWIMVVTAHPRYATPAELGYGTQSLTVFVDDVDAHFAHAKSAGVRIVEELHETVYGERQYGAEDLDGHHWLFSRHARDVSPEEWGATVGAKLTLDVSDVTQSHCSAVLTLPRVPAAGAAASQYVLQALTPKVSIITELTYCVMA